MAARTPFAHSAHWLEPRPAAVIRGGWEQTEGTSLRSPEFRSPLSCEAAPIRGRGQAGVLAKCRCERTGFAKTQIEPDLRHRYGGMRQLRLGLVVAHAGHVAGRRQAGSLLDCPQ